MNVGGVMQTSQGIEDTQGSAVRILCFHESTLLLSDLSKVHVCERCINRVADLYESL